MVGTGGGSVTSVIYVRQEQGLLAAAMDLTVRLLSVVVARPSLDADAHHGVGQTDGADEIQPWPPARR